MDSIRIVMWMIFFSFVFFRLFIFLKHYTLFVISSRNSTQIYLKSGKYFYSTRRHRSMGNPRPDTQHHPQSGLLRTGRSRQSVASVLQNHNIRRRRAEQQRRGIGNRIHSVQAKALVILHRRHDQATALSVGIG